MNKHQLVLLAVGIVGSLVGIAFTIAAPTFCTFIFIGAGASSILLALGVQGE